MTVLDRLDALRTEATPGPWASALDAIVIHADDSGVDFAAANDALAASAVNALPALLRIARAAAKLDREMAEEHSAFTGDGTYERYLRYRTEAELTDALSDLEANT